MFVACIFPPPLCSLVTGEKWKQHLFAWLFPLPLPRTFLVGLDSIEIQYVLSSVLRFAAGGGQWQRRRGVPFDSMADVEELNRLVAQLTVSLRQQNEARERPTAQSDEENGSDENDLGRGESDSGSYKSHASVGSESLPSERDDLPVHSIWDLHDHDEMALQDCGNLAEKRRYGEIVQKNKELCWPFFVKHLECLWTKQTWPLTELITEETLQKILLKHFLEPEEDVTLEEGTRVIAVPNPRRRGYTLQGTMYQQEAKALSWRRFLTKRGRSIECISGSI